MKKIVKIIIAVVVSFVLLMLIVPMFFIGTVEQKLQDEINKQINASVSWEDIDLSLFRSFPDITLGIEGLSVVGKDKFEQDTLLAFNEFSVSVNLMKVIGGEIQINEIVLDKPLMNAIVAQDSTVNWDIMIPSNETDEEVEDTVSDSSEMMAQMQLFKINDARLYYIDSTMQLMTGIEGFNAELSGDLGASLTTLDIQSSIENLFLSMEGSQLLNRVKIGLNAKLKSDLDSMVFTFTQSDFSINQLSLGIDGSFGMLEEGYDMDLKMFARETDFKTLLGLVPADMMEGYEDIKTSGKMALQIDAKGTYVNTDHLPAFEMVLTVNDASIQYPDLPESLEDIQIETRISNPGGGMDLTVTDISKFHIKLGSNPFDASLNVVTPISNATYKGSLVGTIDMESLQNALPLDSMTMKGIITSNIELAGDYNMIETEDYESIKADGSIDMKGFEYSSIDLAIPFIIDDAELLFSPRYLDLSTFKSRMGSSDFAMTGRLDNYLAYALKDDILKGKLTLNSGFINIDELMALSSDDTATVEEAVDTLSIEAVAIPKNIDFVMAARIKKMTYDKLEMTNAIGNISIKEGKLVLDGLNTNMLNGSMVMTGQYNAENPEKPFVDFKFNATKIDVNKAAHSFSVVESILPVAKMAKGLVGANFSYSSKIGSDMMPILNTVNGLGNIQSEAVELSGSKVQSGLVSLLKDDKYETFTAKDLLVKFKLTNGNLFVEPFTTKIYDKSVTVEGRQSVDQSMEYKIGMPLSRKEVVKLGGLLGVSVSSDGDDLPIDVIIKGTVTDPELILNLDKAKDQLEKEVGEDVKKEVEKQVDKIMEDPEVKKKVEDAKKKLNNLFK